MAIKLPPPPTNAPVNSPVWQDWFYKLIALVNTALPDNDQTIEASQIFGRRQTTIPLNITAVNSDTILPGQSFAPLRPTVPANVADSTSILAGQIFGS